MSIEVKTLEAAKYGKRARLATDKAGQPATGPVITQLTDGRGLYLKLMPTNAHSWRFDFKSPADGKRKTLYLGTYPDIGLAEARKRAQDARNMLAEKPPRCPVAERDAARTDEKAAQDYAAAVAKGGPIPGSFEAVAREYHASKWQAPDEAPAGFVSEWSDLYARQWLQTMENHVFPVLGAKLMGAIQEDEVVEMLAALRTKAGKHAEGKTRVFLGSVFRAGRKLTTIRIDDLRDRLPKVPKPTPFPSRTTNKGIAQILQAIDGCQHETHRDLTQIMALVWQRPGPVCAMEWSELDLDGGSIDWSARGLDLDYDSPCWVVPAAKMKGDKEFKANGKPHIVPLPTQAVEILKRRKAQAREGCAYVFPGAIKRMQPVDLANVSDYMKDNLKLDGIITPHGFRAMARTYLEESLGFREKALEKHLAHSNGLATGESYERASCVHERTVIQQRWADTLDAIRRGDVVSQKLAAFVQKMTEKVAQAGAAELTA